MTPGLLRVGVEDERSVRVDDVPVVPFDLGVQLSARPARVAREHAEIRSRVLAVAEPSPGAVVDGWGAYERSLETPGWRPRFDRVIREYFTATGQRGLR